MATRMTTISTATKGLTVTPSRLLPTLVLISFLLFVPLSVHGRGPVPSTLVIDPCREYLPEPGEPQEWFQVSELAMIDLSGTMPVEIAWVPSADRHGGATFASVPGYEQEYVFATHGAQLDVYKLIRDRCGQDLFDPVRSVDLGLKQAR